MIFNSRLGSSSASVDVEMIQTEVSAFRLGSLLRATEMSDFKDTPAATRRPGRRVADLWLEGNPIIHNGGQHHFGFKSSGRAIAPKCVGERGTKTYPPLRPRPGAFSLGQH